MMIETFDRNINTTVVRLQEYLIRAIYAELQEHPDKLTFFVSKPEQVFAHGTREEILDYFSYARNVFLNTDIGQKPPFGGYRWGVVAEEAYLLWKLDAQTTHPDERGAKEVLINTIYNL
ncbi:MAG: hypothetical protein HYV41_04230 [Candidatus Magasanikbacteria bacterium]|nr:hypothetical protein [Candidatus Magasanikbacteria bacterium]